MIKIILMICVALSSVSVLASTDGNTLEEAIKIKINECQSHFDITPYYGLAFGAEQASVLRTEVATHIKYFLKHGRIKGLLSETDISKKLCMTYVEGLLIGAVVVHSRSYLDDTIELMVDDIFTKQ